MQEPKKWSDSKKYWMGIVASLLVAAVIGVVELYPRDEEPRNHSPLPTALPATFELSETPPFPRGLDSVKPGMRLSAARAVFPDGKLTSSWYSIELDSGPFRNLAFFVYRPSADPRIDAVNLQFRDDDRRREVIDMLLRELDEFPQSTEMLGARVVWADVNGYHLSVSDSSYTIHRAGEDTVPLDQEAAEPTAAPDG